LKKKESEKEGQADAITIRTQRSHGRIVNVVAVRVFFKRRKKKGVRRGERNCKGL